MIIDHTHDPAASSWIAGADNHSDFPVQNLPFGIFSHLGRAARVGCAIGDYIVDLGGLANTDLLPQNCRSALQADQLNPLFAMPRDERIGLRHALFELLTREKGKSIAQAYVMPAAECDMPLPFNIGDYTDFYVGIHHATNIGNLFRPDNPLLPNYKYVPIGYHGRASSIRSSGAPVRRPNGQRLLPGRQAPDFGPCRRLDYELELGVWIAGGNHLGEAIAIADAPAHIGGYSLLNDWSARDLQAWEYQPLGPFLAKSFMTTVSPWVVTSEAMAPFMIAQPPRGAGDPQPLSYLNDQNDAAQGALSIALEVELRTSRMRQADLPAHLLGESLATNMYWTVAQMVTHHASNGCNLNSGDLLGTGTISGPETGSYGSLMEISAGGARPITLHNGETRTFLEDGDEIIFRARAQRAGYCSIGFGPCCGTVIPAQEL